MPFININFPSPINVSCQVGDWVWTTNVVSQDSNNVFFHGDMGNIIRIGHIVELINPDGSNNEPIIIRVKTQGAPPTLVNNDFLIFSKNKTVNTSGLKGYFASVVFQNNSRKEAELFSVGALAELSSK